MKKILDSLTKLILESSSLRELEKNQQDSFSSDLFVQRHSRWINNCHQILSYATLEDFLDRIKLIHRPEDLDLMDSTQISKITGILESAKETLEQGFSGKLRYLLHAEMFNSILEQAEELHATGHILPAAVLGRIVIERWLRDRAEKAGIQNWDTDRASVVNDNLKKAGVFSTPKWRRIQSFLDIGNAAAHGKEADFNFQDVKFLIDFAKMDCTEAF